MNILCLLVGHKPPCYWRTTNGDYMALVSMGVDGCEREHARVIGECPRCKHTYEVGWTHLIPRKREKEHICAV